MTSRAWKDKLKNEFAKLELGKMGPRKKSRYEDDIMKIGVNMGIFTNPKSVKKNKGGKISKYYKDGGQVMTGRNELTPAQKNLPEMLQKKILAAKKKK